MYQRRVVQSAPPYFARLRVSFLQMHPSFHSQWGHESGCPSILPCPRSRREQEWIQAKLVNLDHFVWFIRTKVALDDWQVLPHLQRGKTRSPGTSKVASMCLHSRVHTVSGPSLVTRTAFFPLQVNKVVEPCTFLSPQFEQVFRLGLCQSLLWSFKIIYCAQDGDVGSGQTRFKILSRTILLASGFSPLCY